MKREKRFTAPTGQIWGKPMIRNRPFAATMIVFALSFAAIQPAAATAAVRAACGGEARAAVPAWPRLRPGTAAAL
jgi:hypothetical protein